MLFTARYYNALRSSYVCNCFPFVSHHVKTDLEVAPAKRIMSLKEPQSKMSKSHADPRSRILINDSREEIATKVRLAVTDSLSGVTYEPEKRPGVSNLLAIMSYLDERGKSCQELAEMYHNMTMRQLKDEAVQIIDHALAGIRERYEELLSGPGDPYLDDVAQEGAHDARRVADMTMTTVRKAVGLA